MNGSSGAGGLFSSFSALFGGSTNASSSSSSSRSKASSFGSGYPSSSSRRGPHDDDAWSLPYNYGNARSTSGLGGAGANGSMPGTPNSSSRAAYPPSLRASGYPAGTVNTDSLANLASASTHTLVPQARPSLSEARAATGVSIPSTSFPPLRHTWNRIRTWSENSYPELKDTLNWPATEQQIDELEYTIGFSLPPAVRDSYLCHNGQELESNQSCQDGIFFGLPLLSIDQIAQEWQFWRAVDDDPTSGANLQVRQWQSSCPDKWVRAQYSCRGWIPLISDRVGNYIGVDVTPHPSGGGAPGQVIIFGRDFDTKVVVWRGEGEGGWGRFLQYVAEEFESGELWTLEEPSSGSEDEEDAIGYESYFSNGGAGASRGGGDRGGEGSAGFRLTGEYRGWAVMEAWADRSMRCWEEVGLPSGLSASEETPDVRLSYDDVDGENEASGSGARIGGDGIEVQGPDDHPLRADDSVEGGHVQASATGRPFSPHLDSPQARSSGGGGERRISDTLSPPAPSTKASRSRQKQRAGAAGGVGGGSPGGSPTPPSSSQLRPFAPAAAAAPRRPPPAPAAPIDLPTIEDVKAVQAAALAAHERSARVQYADLEHRGGGGGGIIGTMGSLTLGRNGTLKQDRSAPNPARGSTSSSSSLSHVELENRTSVDALHGTGESSSSGSMGHPHVVVVGEPRRSTQSPRVLSPRSSSSVDRPNYFEPTSASASAASTSQPPQSPNLMDISSVPSSPNLHGNGSARSSVDGPAAGGYTASPLGRHASGTSTPTRGGTGGGSLRGSAALMAAAAGSNGGAGEQQAV